MSKIQIDEQIERDEWEAFLLSLPCPPFLQSWNMRELHSAIGENSLAAGIRVDGRLAGLAFVVEVQAKRGNYLYLPYGPVFERSGWDALPALTAYLKRKGSKIRADFIRSSPFIADSQEYRSLYRRCGYRPAPIHMLAEHIWWLDITPNEDVLLKGMRKTMRNLIRRCDRDGVQIRMETSDEAVNVFSQIHQDTVQRHGFVPYHDEYFMAQVRAFRGDGQVAVFIAEHEGTPISAAIMMFYGDMASYHHGASLSEYGKIPASYGIQWAAIQEAKRRGCSRYNFWGVVPEEKQLSPFLKRKHPWIGISKFKTGFGGSQFDLLHCQDYPLTLKYQMTRVIETARRIKRGH